MSAYLGPRCMYCKHFIAPKWTCAAFPQGIPYPLIRGDAEHLTPYEGDHGIQFELDPALPDEDKDAYRTFFEKKTE